MFGWVEDLGKAVVNGVATQAEVLGDVATGNYKGAIQAITGSDSHLYKHGTGPGDLVQQIQQGPGTPTLQRASDIGTRQADEQLQIEQQSRQMATDLESAWTGKSSDAAVAQIQPLADTARSASEALASNSNIVQDQIHQFDSLKASMHTDVTNQAPERGFWDKATPWDTSTEDQINQRNQKVQENLARYNTYAQQTDANKPAMTIDYGQLSQQQDGTFKVENKPILPPDPPPPPPVYPPTTGHPPTNNPQDPRIPSQSRTQVPTIPHLPGDILTGHPPGSTEQSIPSPTHTSYDQTHTSGYTPPGTSNTNYPGYQQSGFGPGSGGGSGSGGFAGGFGPGGGGGFGPGGSGSSSGSGSGGSSSGQGLGGGRGSGAGLPGEGAGQSGIKGGAAGAAGAGRGGQSGMGGMGGGQKGQGGEDAEHERASYLMEADPESIFGSDVRATPPVIGE